MLKVGSRIRLKSDGFGGIVCAKKGMPFTIKKEDSTSYWVVPDVWSLPQPEQSFLNQCGMYYIRKDPIWMAQIEELAVEEWVDDI